MSGRQAPKDGNLRSQGRRPPLAWRLLAPAAAALCVAGCSTLARLPLVGSLFVPKPKYLLCTSPRFAFEYPRKWGDPVEIDGGAEMRSPDRRASFAIVYVRQDHKGYKPPEEFRRDMAAWGAVEDSHRVERVTLSTTAAYQVEYTTYEYDPQTLLGEKVRVLFSQVRMAPWEDGMYVVRYRAEKDAFSDPHYWKQYDHFLKSLTLAVPPRKKVEEE